MKQSKINISSPKIGMNKSSSQYLLESSFYTHMLNGQTFDESGNKITISNEHSNVLANKFKEGFKVIGFKNDVIKNKTYFFLLNPTTNVSEFGCIENITQIQEVEDKLNENCKDCQKTKRILGTPLENITQTEHQEYITILEDSCNNCLNLNIDFPIYDIEIKTENIGERLFFTDGLNEPRYIELDKIDQYKVEGEEVCDNDTLEPTCLDCDKLRIFKLYKNPIALSYNRVLGGNLDKGIYEFAFAYSDELGNELTSYIPLTSTISIFDENSVIQSSDEENNNTTNFAIKIELSELDQRFTNYKLVMIETSFGQAQIFKEVGLYTTADNIVLVSNNRGNEITRQEVITPKISIKSWQGLTASNNYLFGYGIKENEVPNLQPVFNLLGGALKWNSAIAKEDLYEKANSNQFKGYNRDEVVPFAIEPISNDDFKFPIYPLIGRPANQTDLEIIDNKDSQSINSVGNDCDSILRNKRWQFYNTATVDSNCIVTDIPTTEQTEFIQTFTEVEVPSIPQGQITIDSFNIVDFVDVENYIEDNQFTCGDSPYDNSPIQSICQYLDLDNLTAFNNEPNLETNCTNLQLVREEVEVVEVINETREETNKQLEDYARLRPFSSCQVQDTQNVDNAFSEQYSLRYRQASNGSKQREGTLYKRTNQTFADTPQLAVELVIVKQEFLQNYVAPATIFPYFGANIPSTAINVEERVANAVTDKNANPLFVASYTNSDIGGLYQPGADPLGAFTGDAEATLFDAAGVFTNKIHKGSVWYKVDVREKDFLLLEISRLLEPNNTTYRLDSGIPFFRNKYVRFHVFATPYEQDPIEFSSYEDENGLTTNIPVGGIFRLSSTPDLIPIDKSIIDQSIDGYIYLVADLPFSQGKGLGTDNFIDDDDNPPIIDTVITIPPGSCFSVNAREVELSKIDIFYDEIKLKKIQEYSSQCVFDVPVLDDCEPLPYKKGTFAYTESTEKYPDNKELFDSSILEIETTDIPDSYKEVFENYYVDSTVNNQYTLNTETEFYCKPIRHFKFPDNIISPFMSFSQQATNSESVIYPLGISIDTEVVNAFLDIAVKNNLLTQKRRDSIIGYKIHRGDTTLDRSVQSSGLLFDLRKYTDSAGDIIHYSNFPYNARGEDKLTTKELGSLEDNNYLFTAHTPELDYYKDTPPTEISIQGFQFGKSSNVITEVEEHPEWVILGRKARSLASTLATLEVTAEAVIAAAQASASAQVWGFAGPAGVGASAGVPAFVAAGVIAAFGAVSAVVFKAGRYRYEWLQTFRNLGSPKNFAYYNTSIGKYNYMLPVFEDENKIRRLSVRKNIKDGFFSTQDNSTGEILKINNIDREWSTLISTTSDYEIEFPTQYLNYDNNSSAPNISSQPLSSEVGCNVGRSREFYRNIASPYVAFKNYIPNQYGNINSIRWMDTNKFIPSNDTSDCNLILGGDTFICRHSIKRKTPIFNTNSFDQADLTPFNYGSYSNFGQARYYIDYETSTEVNTGGRFFPDIDYVLNTDCGTSTNSFYFQPPSKFYLWYYGQPSFLTETRINTNFRTARPEPKDQFYPQNQDYVELTQEKNVSIRERNRFYYNINYSYQGTNFSNVQLPPTYSKEVYDKIGNNLNTVMYSRQDNNENSISEPWLVYRPLDRYTFPAAYGQLKRLKGIESNQVLGTFENQSIIFNANDAYVDGITVNNTELGTGGIFARRPKTFADTDLGYLGTQNHALLSCEYGHFVTDTKRGQVFKILPNGQGMEEISKYSGGRENGMDVWFKEHLPFKILRDFKNFNKLDNSYNGVGISIGWDSKFRRVFITKKDYRKSNKNDVITYNPDTRFFIENSVEYTIQDLIENGKLKEVSWTISYKPETGAWESFFDFKPNYYINHTDYFQTGVNQTSNLTEFGLWSHLLTNKSKQVFYGKKYPFIIGYPVKNEYYSKKLETLYFITEAKRYHNSYDFSSDDSVTFNKAVIYNDRESSGNLELDVNTGVLSLLSKYPITQKDSQRVLITQNDNKWSLNYFYNRVKSNKNNITLFNYDENQISKEVNQNSVSFKGKSVLERMTGNYFMVQLTQDKTSQYDLELRWSLDKTQQEL